MANSSAARRRGGEQAPGLVVACRALGAVPAPVTVNVMAGNAQDVVQVGEVGRRSPD
ncbi:hypothetical protein AB0I60_21840 [Actinosynnema sp. NPDC050436]|uniref:hypothetical protein n=1 Tax=Actinosynnema sp. NPDC050436 TaxID=3155659 RepID=UPI0033F56769